MIDRLGAACLGPYGNTWVDTPCFNALASQATLLENLLVDSPDLQQVYRGYLSGRHVLQGATAAASIVPEISGAGVATSLITDDPQLTQSPVAEAWAETLLVESDPPARCADAIEETALAKLFAQGVGALQQQASPFLLWIHARGMGAPWDAPLALRQSLAAEDDPDPLETVEAPALQLAEDYDPDELLGIVQAYAAQVMLLDACLGALLDAIEQHSQHRRMLTIVTSPRGFPLGEHRIVGPHSDALFGELLHAPCFLWRGDGVGALARRSRLAHPPDVAATLADWFGVQPPAAPELSQSWLPWTDAAPALPRRDRLLSAAGDERALRTPAWFLRRFPWNESLPPGEIPRELYRKPDDRWEVNDVATRCPHIADQLVSELEETEQAIRSGDFSQLSALPEELIEGIE